MPNIVIAGAQWGDEGKGKVVDLLTHNVQVVARYNGGHNAGHTLLVSDDKFVLQSVGPHGPGQPTRPVDQAGVPAQPVPTAGPA